MPISMQPLEDTTCQLSCNPCEHHGKICDKSQVIHHYHTSFDSHLSENRVIPQVKRIHIQFQCSCCLCETVVTHDELLCVHTSISYNVNQIFAADLSLVFPHWSTYGEITKCTVVIIFGSLNEQLAINLFHIFFSGIYRTRRSSHQANKVEIKELQDFLSKIPRYKRKS